MANAGGFMSPAMKAVAMKYTRPSLDKKSTYLATTDKSSLKADREAWGEGAMEFS